MTKDENKPLFSAKAGRVDTAVWENESKEGLLLKSVTFRKSWTKDGKKWDEAKLTLFPQEIPDAILVLQETYKEIRMGMK